MSTSSAQEKTLSQPVLKNVVFNTHIWCYARCSPLSPLNFTRLLPDAARSSVSVGSFVEVIVRFAFRVSLPSASAV